MTFVKSVSFFSFQTKVIWNENGNKSDPKETTNSLKIFCIVYIMNMEMILQHQNNIEDGM